MNQVNITALEVHFRAWQELSERLRMQLTPALEIQVALSRSLQPILDAQNLMQQQFPKSILAQQEYWNKLIESVQIPRIAPPDLSGLTAQAAEIHRSVQQLVQQLVMPAFEQLQETFRDLPPHIQEALLLLGAHGWYLDLKMPFAALWQLKEALANGNVAEAEEALCEYFEFRLTDIEESISKKYPHRAHLVRSAFAAHRRQEYELSIPVLFAQTDGICKEAVNQYLFIKQNKKPGTAIYVEQIAIDGFRAALLSPLAQTLPIGASERERPAGSGALNRHTVLHGDSLNYGTKTNGLKAVSLLNYVAHVLNGEKKNSNP